MVKLNAIYKGKIFINKKVVHLYLLFLFAKFDLLINLFTLILSNNKIILAQYKDSYITLKIKDKGSANVFYSLLSKGYYPNGVYINGYNQSTITYKYNFNQTDNFVKLVWNNPINDDQKLFYLCSKINEIDLSNFDNSKSTSMFQMFYGCSSMTLINLSNIDTSKVTNMWSMFSKCSLLNSIDLSNFNTSNVENMQYMFGFCSSLTSLNLSNFDTSKVTTVAFMFDGCLNLEYVNFKTFNETILTKYNDIFKNVPNNIVICIDENKIQDKLK